jgi:hypothetical protein
MKYPLFERLIAAAYLVTVVVLVSMPAIAAGFPIIVILVLGARVTWRALLRWNERLEMTAAYYTWIILGLGAVVWLFAWNEIHPFLSAPLHSKSEGNVGLMHWLEFLSSAVGFGGVMTVARGVILMKKQIQELHEAAPDQQDFAKAVIQTFLDASTYCVRGSVIISLGFLFDTLLKGIG